MFIKCQGKRFSPFLFLPHDFCCGSFFSPFPLQNVLSETMRPLSTSLSLSVPCLSFLLGTILFPSVGFSPLPTEEWVCRSPCRPVCRGAVHSQVPFSSLPVNLLLFGQAPGPSVGLFLVFLHIWHLVFILGFSDSHPFSFIAGDSFYRYVFHYSNDFY